MATYTWVTKIGSGNRLLQCTWRHQAITRTNVDLSSIGSLAKTNYAGSARDIISYNEFKRYTGEMSSKSLMDQWLNMKLADGKSSLSWRVDQILFAS